MNLYKVHINRVDFRCRLIHKVDYKVSMDVINSVRLLGYNWVDRWSDFDVYYIDIDFNSDNNVIDTASRYIRKYIRNKLINELI